GGHVGNSSLPSSQPRLAKPAPAAGYRFSSNLEAARPTGNARSPTAAGRQQGRLQGARPEPQRHRLPWLAVRADFHLEGPGVARLLMQLPISLGDRLRPHQLIGLEPGQRLVALAFTYPLAHPGRIHAGIDDEMRHVDTPRAKLAGGSLCHG